MAELREYHPWLRDRIAAAIQGDNPAYSRRGKIARALVGSNGVSPSFGLADFTPAGVPLNAYDFGRHAANNEKMNALLSGVNIIPGAALARVSGVLSKGAEILTGAASGAKIAPMADKIPSSIIELNQPTNALAKPAIDSMSRRGFIGGVGAVGAATMLPGVAGKAVEAVAPKMVSETVPSIVTEHLHAYMLHHDAAIAHENALKDLEEMDIKDYSDKNAFGASEDAFEKSQEANSHSLETNNRDLNEEHPDYEDPDDLADYHSHEMRDYGHDELADQHAASAIQHRINLESITGLDHAGVQKLIDERAKIIQEEKGQIAKQYIKWKEDTAHYIRMRTPGGATTEVDPNMVPFHENNGWVKVAP